MPLLLRQEGTTHSKRFPQLSSTTTLKRTQPVETMCKGLDFPAEQSTG
jgi:hypothetical protein